MILHNFTDWLYEFYFIWIIFNLRFITQNRIQNSFNIFIFHQHVKNNSLIEFKRRRRRGDWWHSLWPGAGVGVDGIRSKDYLERLNKSSNFGNWVHNSSPDAVFLRNLDYHGVGEVDRILASTDEIPSLRRVKPTPSNLPISRCIPIEYKISDYGPILSEVAYKSRNSRNHSPTVRETLSVSLRNENKIRLGSIQMTRLRISFERESRWLAPPAEVVVYTDYRLQIHWIGVWEWFVIATSSMDWFLNFQ